MMPIVDSSLFEGTDFTRTDVIDARTPLPDVSR
jgi:hypothetical protein